MPASATPALQMSMPISPSGPDEDEAKGSGLGAENYAGRGAIRKMRMPVLNKTKALQGQGHGEPKVWAEAGASESSIRSTV